MFLRIAFCGIVFVHCLAQKSSYCAAEEFETIEFAQVDELSLKLDLYRGSAAGKPNPLIVWVHGGAWRRGSRSGMPLKILLERGYSIASVDYRLSPVAPFPANVHDIKGAIRYLRANASELGVDTKRFVVAGSSAGGHLASLVGVTNGAESLEGDVGGNQQASSNVQAIVSFFGASNLTTILEQSTPHGLSVRVPALQLLLRDQPKNVVELARLASPVFHVDESDPPLLLLHGDQDPQMPINQSHELHGVYKTLSLPCEFDVVHGGVHGGKKFYTTQQIDRVDEFLTRHLK